MIVAVISVSCEIMQGLQITLTHIYLVGIVSIAMRGQNKCTVADVIGGYEKAHWRAAKIKWEE